MRMMISQGYFNEAPAGSVESKFYMKNSISYDKVGKQVRLKIFELIIEPGINQIQEMIDDLEKLLIQMKEKK